MLLITLWAGMPHVYISQQAETTTSTFNKGPEGTKEQTTVHKTEYRQQDKDVKVKKMGRKRTREEFEGIETIHNDLTQEVGRGEWGKNGIEKAQTRQRIAKAKKAKIENMPATETLAVTDMKNITLTLPAPVKERELAFNPNKQPVIEQKTFNCHGGKCEQNELNAPTEIDNNNSELLIK